MRRASGASKETGLFDLGIGLAGKTGGEIMWYLPLIITLEVKKTRTSWTLTIRVSIH